MSDELSLKDAAQQAKLFTTQFRAFERAYDILELAATAENRVPAIKNKIKEADDELAEKMKEVEEISKEIEIIGKRLSDAEQEHKRTLEKIRDEANEEQRKLLVDYNIEKEKLDAALTQIKGSIGDERRKLDQALAGKREELKSVMDELNEARKKYDSFINSVIIKE